MIIISAILVAIIFIPFFWAGYYGKSSIKKNIKNVKELARSEGSNINILDSTNLFAIGLDEEAGKIFFYRKDSGEQVRFSVSLENVKNCRLEKEFESLNNKSEKSDALEKITLVINMKNPADEKKCVFYNAPKSGALLEEQALALKWEKLIQERIMRN